MGAGPDLDDGIPVLLTDPVEVLASYERALNERDYDALAALLAPDFRFCVRADDAGQFSWAPDDCWWIVPELGLIANMFGTTSTAGVPPAALVNASFTLLGAGQPGPGVHELTVDAVIDVLLDPSRGYRSVTRFLFTIAEQPDGYLRISRIEEVPVLRPIPRSPDWVLRPATWAQIKANFHSLPRERQKKETGP